MTGALSRRGFLGALGQTALGGLVLTVLPREADAKDEKDKAAKSEAPRVDKPPPGFTPNVFIHVGSDGKIVIMCHRSEMGQGVRSTIPALLAAELGADMAHVTIEQAPGDPLFGDQNTDGSSSIRNAFVELRQIAAVARTMLVAAAARRWKVAPESCHTEKSKVLHAGDARALTFAELADDAGKLPVPKPESVKLLAWKDLHLAEQSLPVIDAPAIVNGTAVFAADVKVPGMLIAVIARPPVVGGKLVKFDATRALALPGVKQVLEIPAPTPPYVFQPWGGVAVLAENTWAAMRGAKALALEWDLGKNASYDSQTYKDELSKSVSSAGTVARKVGDAEGALGKAAKVVQAEYHLPHLAHATMEPPATLAHVTEKHCELWTASQDPQTAREVAAKTLGLQTFQVTVHVTLLGGGFGRKSKADFVAEAALLSKLAGVPVRVQWTREDDLRHDYFHSVSTQQLTAALDDKGAITAWRHRTAFPPIGSTFNVAATRPGAGDLQQGVTDLPLTVPNVLAETCEAPAHVRIGWMRSVYNVFHAFSVNSFIDELAAARGVDPLAQRLELLGPPRKVSLSELGIEKLANYGAKLADHPVDTARMRNVVERVTQAARWDSRKQEGRALGLAAHRSFLTYVAVVAQVSKRADGRIAVDEVWICTDAGTVVNHERARSQMEGAVIFGQSIALHSGMTMKAGVAEQHNFHQYKLTRIGEAPRKIHVDLVESEGLPGGIGEPGVPPVAPAIVNAVFALTGQRVRELPLEKHGLV
ncbi:MAG: xanthine dehydrogenase family protein molybdopterin-binding subunit [Deltaproteobacteria bacterium]|nr:xanthine dehydrogenase family protein molybdopterin-binding subunit [Deltaproteobacteria bacterium]